MKTVLVVLGVLAVAMGLLWAAQGSGYFPYPSSSFMINDVMWVYYGLGTAVAGLIVISVARRRRR
jgi:uncharacterized membrane protein